MESKIETSRKKGGKPKGSPKTGGREMGTPNKATGIARIAFANFVDNNSDKLQQWLDEIATNDKHGPKVAFDCLMQVAEFHVPKLSRIDHVGDTTATVTHIYKWQDD